MIDTQIQTVDLTTQEGVAAFLQQSTIVTAEFLTGLLASDTNAYKLSAGRLLQSVIKNNFFTQLGREIKKYREKGLIKEDYFATNKNQVTLLELLKFIDEQVPEEELFKAAKSIFFTSVEVEATTEQETLAYEFLSTIKKLSGTEILILKANYEISKGDFKNGNTPSSMDTGNRYREQWRYKIALQIGNSSMNSIVDKYEINLENLGLISRREAVDAFSSTFTPTTDFRLTLIGKQFCKYITNYE